MRDKNNHIEDDANTLSKVRYLVSYKRVQSMKNLAWKIMIFRRRPRCLSIGNEAREDARPFFFFFNKLQKSVLLLKFTLKKNLILI